MLTVGQDKQYLEDFTLDEDVQFFGKITLLLKQVVFVIKSCLRIRVDGRKQFEHAIAWKKIFLKTEKEKIRVFKRK